MFSRMQSCFIFYDEYLDNAVMFQQHISKITEAAVQLIRIRADLSPAHDICRHGLFDLVDVRQCERMHLIRR